MDIWALLKSSSYEKISHQASAGMAALRKGYGRQGHQPFVNEDAKTGYAASIRVYVETTLRL